MINGEFAYWSGQQSSNITYLLNADSLERLRNGDVEVDVTIEELENSLIDNPSSVDLASLYDDIESCDYAENFEGEWSSSDLTDVHYGELTITQQDSDGFYFDGDFLYHHGEYPFTDDGPNTGDAIGYAHFINNHLAISRNIIDIDGLDGYDGYAVFYLYNNHLYIRTTGIVGWMGGGVYMDGEYVIN